MTIPKKPIVLVSSTVYGIEELLERIYTLLTSFGYEVWMSHKGTVPVISELSALENCLRAVEKCDLFLGIITTNYGSWIDEKGMSITHHELRKAIQLNKIRWLLVHDHVVFARTLIKKLGYDTPDKRKTLTLKKNLVFSNLLVIDMYEEAKRMNIPSKKPKGNWVQKFRSDNDAQLFVIFQFSRYQEVEAFMQENFKHRADEKGGLQ